MVSLSFHNKSNRYVVLKKIKVDQDTVVVHNNHSLTSDFDLRSKMEEDHLHRVPEYNVDEGHSMVALIDVVEELLIDARVCDSKW